jgi:hypothetical protein
VTRALAVVEFVSIEDGQRIAERLSFPRCTLACHDGTLTVLDEHGPFQWFAPAVSGPGWFHAWYAKPEEPGR